MTLIEWDQLHQENALQVTIVLKVLIHLYHVVQEIILNLVQLVLLARPVTTALIML
jgi:hypothetical protein